MKTLISAVDTTPSPVDSPLQEAIQRALARIPPLWPLAQFVAVNPFLGLSDLSFSAAARRMARTIPGGILPEKSLYQKAWEQGEILPQDLRLAVDDQEEMNGLTEATVTAWLSEPEHPCIRISSLAQAIDQLHETRWAEEILDEISNWLGAFLDQGQSLWRNPWKEMPLYAAWREAMMTDRSAEMLGLRGFRRFVAALPKCPLHAIEELIARAQLKVESLELWLHRELLTVGGWASCLQYRERMGLRNGDLQGLLAIILAYEVALLEQYDSTRLRALWREQVLQQDELELEQVPAHLIWQEAYENSERRRLYAGLKSTPQLPSVLPSSHSLTTLSAQVVCCIDVRSEPMRRALEASSKGIETLGFAGFFGMPVESVAFGQTQGTVRCPVILKPPYRVYESGTSLVHTDQLRQHTIQRKAWGQVWKSFKDSAVSCFSFVEAMGLGFAWSLYRDGIRSPQKASSSEFKPLPDFSGKFILGSGIPHDEQCQLAENLVKSLSLHQKCAPLVVLCGHGACTKNNPYDASLQCGACGGHAGDWNAQIAAGIMNRQEIRAALKARGCGIPDETYFLAAMHHTTTDELEILNKDQVPRAVRPAVHDLEKAFREAEQLARRQRAPQLGISSTEVDVIAQLIEQRSADWSQVRPEWGLAGNSAFLIGPRHLSDNLNLQGKAFLHHYVASEDPEGTALANILAGPMLVTSWINLQYYASRVNHEVYGSGNKTLHNVNGTHGVQLGNGGDLKAGLPWQSLHDGQQWRHDPLRLNVFVDAPEARVRWVMAKNSSVAELIEGRWLHLWVADGDGGWTRL